MTNTINNVPRELLEVIEQTWRINYRGAPVTTDLAADAIEKGLGQLRAILSAPSPAGVGGLNTDRNAAFKACPESGCDWGSFYLGWKARGEVEQAIIDGLRGEIEVMTQHANNYSLMFEECAEERDHLAQCLKFARTTMAVVANNANLRGVEYRSLVTEVKRIDAALSAVCAAAPNIATTSEHSGS